MFITVKVKWPKMKISNIPSFMKVGAIQTCAQLEGEQQG